MIFIPLHFYEQRRFFHKKSMSKG